MKLRFVLPLFLIVCSTSAFAQLDPKTAPVVWQRYQIAERRISIELPKMPIRVDSGDLCWNTDKSSYFAYADESVYEVTVAEKASSSIPGFCRERQRFSNNTLLRRLAELRSGKPEMSETSSFQDERQVYRFAGEGTTRWIVADIENNRWIELSVSRRGDRKSYEEAFVRSLDLTGGTGKDVRKGAPTMIGDPLQATDIMTATPGSPGTEQLPETDQLRVVAKFKAGYTDEARTAHTQGTVRLNIALLANGSVGTIRLEKGLPNGLSENAIEAARKIVFLPARVDGVAISKIVTIEYGFNIY